MKHVLYAAILAWVLQPAQPAVQRRSYFLDGYEGSVAAFGALGPRPKGGSIVPISNSTWQSDHTPLGSDLRCGELNQVTSTSNKWVQCPAACPLFAEKMHDGIPCNFACVQSSIDTCKSFNPDATVVDEGRGICRGCYVDGCIQCSGDGSDTCKQCGPGYQLLTDGTCYNRTLPVWIALFVVFALIAVVVIAWAISLACAPVTNIETVKNALLVRSMAKVHKPESDHYDLDTPREQSRVFWSAWTNLATTDVGGKGLVLFFRFQWVIIFWAFFVAAAWAIMAWAVDRDLFILGTRRAETPRQNCIVVAWGFETQQRLMSAKVEFCYGIYVFSFLGAIVFSIFQLRKYEAMEENLSHADFTVVLENLPIMNGSDEVETDIKTCVEEFTGEKVVGVSVCWNFSDQVDFVTEAIDREICEREGIDPDAPVEAREIPPGLQPVRRLFAKMENLFLHPTTQKVMRKGTVALPSASDKSSASDTVQCLKDIKTSQTAFVVFHTQASVHRAIEKAKERGGLVFRDHRVDMEVTHNEPGSIVWTNFCEANFAVQLMRMLLGIVSVIISLLVWGAVFYLPYVYFAMSFNYAHGHQPSSATSMVFCLMVACGNATMYFVCSEVADRIGFRYADHREICYMLLYSVACTLNVLLDLALTYYICYETIKGIGMRTYDGMPLAEIDTFSEQFETYAMQRELGRNLLDYSFPATFLIPFLVEPWATIYLPWKLMTLLVRSHRGFTAHRAESLLQGTPMDFSRYADLLLNVLLASMVFYFPGGFTVSMFVYLGASHLYIYGFDHYKVLFCIPSCDFSGIDVDWWAQWIFSIPCGIILASAWFKSNCLESSLFPHCHDDTTLFVMCTLVGVMHVAIHTLALLYVVPMFGRSRRSLSETAYKAVAQRIPASWFNLNPVHVLRSRYIYKHNPPCDYFVLGKEHLLRKNNATGSFFLATRCQADDYDAPIVDTEKAALVLRERVNSISEQMRTSLGSILSTDGGAGAGVGARLSRIRSA